MKALDKLIADREEIRAKEKELTAAIKEERKREAEARPVKTKGVSYDDYMKLKSENANIRALASLLKKAEGSTYAEVGKMIGVSSSRARELVERSKRKLLFDDYQDRKLNT